MSLNQRKYTDFGGGWKWRCPERYHGWRQKNIFIGSIAHFGRGAAQRDNHGIYAPVKNNRKANRIALAFLGIEMGKTNAFELCRTLFTINPRTNVVYLTAYIEYSFDTWSTGASDFTLKPITAENVCAQLKNLRYPFSLGGEQDWVGSKSVFS